MRIIVKPPKIPELLAPAGSMDALRAAVAAGADAVYLGGKRFGARKFAANFSDEEMQEAIRYCHLRNVRVYVTVNTLIHDRELRETLVYLIDLYKLGVDAVLIQDKGLARLAHEILPGLTIHASTQMTVHNTEGVREAAKQGFSRVVLAREIPLREVEKIAEGTRDLNTGLEVFAHGALCYSYSGQCLLSSCIGGRSGNRGSCAQPCRKPYDLVSVEPDTYGRPEKFSRVPLRDRYLLSTKDLCTVPVIEKIAASPVASLKIEGRMRTPEYVAVVVSVYRKMLDNLRDGKYRTDSSDAFFLEMAFSRGFTSGYLANSPAADVMGRDLPGNRGVHVGRVQGFDQKSGIAQVHLKGRLPLRKGDGFVIRVGDAEKDEVGFVLSREPSMEHGILRVPVPSPIPKGAEVYLTRSGAFDEYANGILKSGNGVLTPIPVALRFTVGTDGVPHLLGTIPLPDGTRATPRIKGESPFLPAKTRPLSSDLARAQLEKTSGTFFTVSDFSAEIKGDWFAPPGILNQLRRDLLAALEDLLAREFSPAPELVQEAEQRLIEFTELLSEKEGSRESRKIPASGTPEVAIYTDSLKGVREAVSSGADRIYFEPLVTMPECPPYQNGRQAWYQNLLARIAREIHAALEISQPGRTKIIWMFPGIVRDVFLESALPNLPDLLKRGLAGCMVEDSGAGEAIRKSCPDCTLFGGIGLNIFNAESMQSLADRYPLQTISPELSHGDIRELVKRIPADSGTCIEMLVQGNLVAMVTEDRLLPLMVPKRKPEQVFGLRDGTGRIFPINGDSECRTHIRNAVELCLADHLPEILKCGIRSVAIDARNRPAEYIEGTVTAYRRAFLIVKENPPDSAGSLAGVKEEIRGLSWGGITSGHFTGKPDSC